MRIFAPVLGEKDLLGRVHETGLGMSGRVEDLAGIFVRRGHDDKATHTKSAVQSALVPI